MNEEIKRLVKTIPNDAELGGRIRMLYNGLYGNDKAEFARGTFNTQENQNRNDGKQILND